MFVTSKVIRLNFHWIQAEVLKLIINHLDVFGTPLLLLWLRLVLLLLLFLLSLCMSCALSLLSITINMNITSVGRLLMLTLMFYVAATAHLSIWGGEERDPSSVVLLRCSSLSKKGVFICFFTSAQIVLLLTWVSQNVLSTYCILGAKDGIYSYLSLTLMPLFALACSKKEDLIVSNYRCRLEEGFIFGSKSPHRYTE